MAKTQELSETISYGGFTLFSHILRLDTATPTQSDNYSLATSKSLVCKPKRILPTALERDLKSRNIMSDSHEDLLKARIMARGKDF